LPCRPVQHRFSGRNLRPPGQNTDVPNMKSRLTPPRAARVPIESTFGVGRRFSCTIGARGVIPPRSRHSQWTVCNRMKPGRAWFLAADGFLKAMGATREALSMSVAERRHKRIGQPAFWSRQTENTLDRATAMMPRLLYDRLDELCLDFVVVYLTAGLRFPRVADDASGRDPRLQCCLGRLFQRSRGPADAGGDHPNAYSR